MTIACPACERRLQASAELAGKPVQCPMCSHIFEASHVEVEWPLPVLKLELDEPLVEPPLSEANIAALPTLELVEEESPLAFPRPAAATRLQERQRRNRGMIAGLATADELAGASGSFSYHAEGKASFRVVGQMQEQGVSGGTMRMWVDTPQGPCGDFCRGLGGLQTVSDRAGMTIQAYYRDGSGAVQRLTYTPMRGRGG